MNVLGALEVGKALGELANAEKHVMDSLMEAGEVVYEEARANCKSSSVREAIQRPKVDEESRLGRPAVVIRVEHERAAVEEFGTGPREGQEGPHNFPARSFMRKAGDESRGKVLDKITGGLEQRFKGSGGS